MRAILLSLALLTACSSTGAADKADNPDGADTDPDGTPLPDDTDAAGDSDTLLDSDVAVDTDDEFDDTFVGSDTDADTGTTGGPSGPVDTTIPNIHAGIHTPGQTLRIRDVVVTAKRICSAPGCPPASNGFTVQDPTVTIDAGLYVATRNTLVMPDPGDTVTLVGEYEEWPGQNIPPGGTQSRFNIHASLPATSWTITGSQAVPAPKVLTYDNLLAPATAEDHESMRVTLQVATDLYVLSGASSANGQFSVGRTAAEPTTTRLLVTGHFYDARDDYAVGNTDRVGSITGVLYHEVNAYKLAPRGQGELGTYTDN